MLKVKDLYAVFYKFAVPVSDSKLREARLWSPLLHCSYAERILSSLPLLPSCSMDCFPKVPESEMRNALMNLQGT